MSHINRGLTQPYYQNDMVFPQVYLPTLGIFWHPFHPLDRFADIQELITKFDFEQVTIF